MIATGAQVNADEEGSGIARETLQVFFPKFGEWFVQRFYDDWVEIPTTAEEILTVEKPFRMVGLPGAICSRDGVHVGWDRSGAFIRMSLIVAKATTYNV